MFVNNVGVLNNIYKCNKKFGEYIVNHYNIPVLSISDNTYFFSKTEELSLAIKKIPFITKLFYGGVSHE